MDGRYKGLANIGATCYMNSLLQTLYMTPEFRQAIYQWTYNDKLHPKPQDSILYQLQKLFGKLDRNFPAEVTTRDLVKSFQWQDEEAQMQQDIQEFNRVLFQALEKSLKTKKDQSGSHFVRDLYEGEMIHYTHCKECENESQKEEYFQDLILTVKNSFEKVYNNCVELGLQRYMKPETLDQNNLYKCEACQKLVQAERGVRFLKMPKLLNIILRRFDFDYFTFQRVKVNDRVEFPHVLNMNNYMQGYANIQNKCNEDSSAYFLDKEVPYPKQMPAASTTTHRKVITKKSGTPNVAGKVTTKPSANTKSFLSEMRKKKIQSQDLNEDLVYVSGNAEIHRKQNGMESQLKANTEVKSAKLPAKDPVQGNEGSGEVLSAELSKTQTIQSNTSLNSEQKEDTNVIAQHVNSQMSGVLPPPPPLLNLEPPKISEPYSKIYIEPGVTAEEELAAKFLEKQKLGAEKEKKLEEQQKKNQELIQEYLKEGGLVYELYAVMVHNGSANHGHYYSYIRSFEDNRWYCFNDDRVTEISVEEIEKTYGGVGHSNAYALYYRQVSKEGEEPRTFTIPNYIQNCIEEEMAYIKRKQKEKVENLQNILVLKIYYQLSVKLLEINKSSTLDLCLTKAREMFDIPASIPMGNSRLRMFNPVSETKLETFGGKEQMSLEQLKIFSFKSLLLEIKKDSEVFEQYIAGKINLRVAFWEQCQHNLRSLDESHLTIHKISVFKGALIKDVEKAMIEKRFELKLQNSESENESISIVKRHQNDEYSYHEIINLADNRDKTIDELMIMQNEILFLEPDSDKLRWPEEFENQLYRITIKYVNGETGQIQSHLTDSRKTIGELKESICKILNFDSAETIIKRGNRSGMELKNLSSSMKDSRFISGTQVYLEKGLPAKPGEIRIQLFIATDASEECYNRLHEFEFVADVPINGQYKASDVKEIFCSVLKKYKNMDLKANQFRIREKVCDKIGKIYRERPMKEQQLIEKRQIAIEMNPNAIDDKEFLVYVRVWNPETWTLTKKIQLNVSKNTNMKDFAELIFKQNKEVPIEEMEICRILSINKFSILDLCEMEYFQMTEASVVAEPLFVNADGLMFVVKSSRKQPRSLTKEEQAKFGGNIKLYSKTTRGRQNMSGTIKKQKGVTIKVVENKDEEDKQQNSIQEEIEK